jgi:hypothetical protein
LPLATSSANPDTTVVVQQRGFRLLLTTIFVAAALVFLVLAHQLADQPKKAGVIVAGFSLGGLFLAAVWLLLGIRALRSGVTIKGDQKRVRRIFWSRRLPLSDVTSFELAAGITYSAWWGSARLRDGKRVRLPFCASPTGKDSPRNQPTLAPLAQLDSARIGLTDHPEEARP